MSRRLLCGEHRQKLLQAEQRANTKAWRRSPVWNNSGSGRSWRIRNQEESRQGGAWRGEQALDHEETSRNGKEFVFHLR